MKKTKFVTLSLLIGILLLSLTACSGTSTAPTAASSTTVETSNVVETTAALQDTQETPISQKLLLGTLLLEDSDLAVTPEQAAELLPLWKAVKAIATSDTAASAEIEALYRQIQESMTASQIKAIEEMETGVESMQTVMDNLGIDMAGPGGGAGANAGAEMTEEQKAQMLERMQAQGNTSGVPGGGPGGGQGGGGGLGGGVPPAGGDFAAGDPGALPAGEDNTTRNLGTARAGFNNFLIEPLIELLTTRAAE